jgi:histidinol phosphatase-like PHP family hydrolase
MSGTFSRRQFLGGAAALGASPVVSGKKLDSAGVPGFAVVDYHVHLDQVVTLDKALELSKQLGVRFGIVEHAGTKANHYPGLLSTDQDLKRYIEKLSGRRVYKGIQAEGLDWMTCFSKELIAELDYTLSDALTFPEKGGERVELWRPWVKVEDPADFMDRYTDFNVEVITREPIDIMANPTFLPDCLMKDYDSLWTRERMEKIVEAAVKHRVAIEINSRYLLPRAAFLNIAKRAGARFSFGSNIHGLDVGKLDYSIEMAKQLGLKKRDLFLPARPGNKPVQTRTFA